VHLQALRTAVFSLPRQDLLGDGSIADEAVGWNSNPIIVESWRYVNASLVVITVLNSDYIN